MRNALALVLSAALGAATASAAPPARGLQVEWVDVEGGAATLIVTPAGESVLIDTGWDGGRDADRIKAAAARAGVTRIDHLVVTHWHHDHVGGVADLAQRLPIGHFYDHGFPDPLPDLTPELKEAYLRTTKGASRVLRPGDTIELRQAPGTPPLDDPRPDLPRPGARRAARARRRPAPAPRSRRTRPARTTRATTIAAWAWPSASARSTCSRWAT